MENFTRIKFMSTNLPARLPQTAVETAVRMQERIKTLVRVQSPAMTLACRQAGLPLELAEMCGGLLASVVDDLVTASNLRRTDFERTKRLERVIAACHEPAASALKVACAASPINGRAAIAHWDKVCESHDIGKMAWLLGMQDSVTGERYGRRMGQRA